jgi:hypothetical protein
VRGSEVAPAAMGATARGGSWMSSAAAVSGSTRKRGAGEMQAPLPLTPIGAPATAGVGAAAAAAAAPAAGGSLASPAGAVGGGDPPGSVRRPRMKRLAGMAAGQGHPIIRL